MLTFLMTQVSNLSDVTVGCICDIIYYYFPKSGRDGLLDSGEERKPESGAGSQSCLTEKYA